MILRRVIEHVKTQNWTAVALDFVIVVMGVFIGIQLGNWNASQAEQRNYHKALERYKAELRDNIAVLDIAAEESRRSLSAMRPAFDALLSCEDTPENRALIEKGILGVSGTQGVHLQISALRELTESPSLLAQQSEEERRRFSAALHTLNIFLREAEYAETIPLEERVQNNPLLTVGPSVDRRVTYFGVDYSRPMRALKLNAPVDVACNSEPLVKYFYTWERWQSVTPVIIGVLRRELETNLEALQ